LKNFLDELKREVVEKSMQSDYLDEEQLFRWKEDKIEILDRLLHKFKSSSNFPET